MTDTTTTTTTTATTPQATTPTEIVAGLYQAFGAGDLPAILARIAPGADWGAGLGPLVAGADVLPSLGHFEGVDGAVAYFTAVGASFDFHRFVPLWIVEAGDEVVSLLDLELTMKATGRRIEIQEIHRFRFDADGRIDRYRNHLDTATMLAAATPS